MLTTLLFLAWGMMAGLVARAVIGEDLTPEQW